MLLPQASEMPTHAKYHRQQQEHTEQLDDHCRVADGHRDGVPGADHLGDVVNDASQHHASGLRIEPEQDAKRRIDQHGKRGECIDRHYDESDVRLLAGVIWHYGHVSSALTGVLGVFAGDRKKPAVFLRRSEGRKWHIASFTALQRLR